MLRRQVAYKYHSWTHVKANWSADESVKWKRRVPIILLILSQPPKRIAAAVSVVAVAAAEAYPTGLEGMVDVTAVSVRFTCGAPCNKTTIRQDQQRQASVFHRQINQTDWQTSHGVYYSVMAAQWRTECSDHWQELNFQILINPSNIGWLQNAQYRWAPTKILNSLAMILGFLDLSAHFSAILTLWQYILNKNTEPEEVVINISWVRIRVSWGRANITPIAGLNWSKRSQRSMDG